MLNLDRGMFLKHPECLIYKSLSGYMSELISKQDNLLKSSAPKLLRADTLRLTTAELNDHTVYLPDTHVLVHCRAGLHTFWKGPLKVLEGRDSRYKLLDLITLKEKEFHLSDMKPFVFDASRNDTLDVAQRDNMES